jgi:hypothetical protein
LEHVVLWRLYRPEGKTVPGEHWSTPLCGASTGQKVKLYLESIGARRFVAPLPARRLLSRLGLLHQSQVMEYSLYDDKKEFFFYDTFLKKSKVFLESS